MNDVAYPDVDELVSAAAARDCSLRLVAYGQSRRSGRLAASQPDLHARIDRAAVVGPIAFAVRIGDPDVVPHGKARHAAGVDGVLG